MILAAFPKPMAVILALLVFSLFFLHMYLTLYPKPMFKNCTSRYFTWSRRKLIRELESAMSSNKRLRESVMASQSKDIIILRQIETIKKQRDTFKHRNEELKKELDDFGFQLNDLRSQLFDQKRVVADIRVSNEELQNLCQIYSSRILEYQSIIDQYVQNESKREKQ